jgi:transposase-like protein
MAQVHLTLDDEIVKGLLTGNRDEAMAKLLEGVLNTVLKAQATEQLSAEPYERNDDRATYRNGYRPRPLTTRIGTLTLRVPKFRDGTFSTELFQAYQRSEKALVACLMEIVIQGVSTRKISEITEILCGTSFSKSAVSAMCEGLTPLVEAFRSRPLERNYPFLIVDAIYMRVREDERIKSKGLLIAIGINEDGHREIVGFTVADGESEEAWNDFFLSLKRRGLSRIDTVTSDNHGGLRNAIRKQFHGASWQRCQTHFSKNLLDKTPKKAQSTVKRALDDLYNAPDMAEAKARKQRMLELFRADAPKAMDLLESGFDDITAVFALPEPYRKRLRTTNGIERVNEELRRRERVIRIFPNEDSLIRLMGTLLMELHEKWAAGKKYFSMECYFEEREDARKRDQAERSHLHVVS